MCGITGYLNTDQVPASEITIQNMIASLAHRGPDGEDIFVRGPVALGHRRLAIIDPTLGQQPLANEDKQIWISYNGELYNYLELRADLQTKGHIFQTNSDTETVVHAYEEWGENCVKRFRGMFAFGIVDYRQNRLFLARDQLGIKPLYYVYQTGTQSTRGIFGFASELQALLKIPDLKLTLNLPAIDQYLWLQYIPAPDTIFCQIRKLPPGNWISISFEGKITGPEEYWKLEPELDFGLSEADWVEAIDTTLQESVQAHLISDVPFGAFLSGGIDSSAVVAYMAQAMSKPVKTFSIGFEEQEFNELPYAGIVARQWNTDHHEEIVKPEALQILPSLVQHYGEPFGDSSAIPTYYVCKAARQFVPMVLSGDGGDEAFLGYQSYRSWMEWLAQDDLKKKPAWKRPIYPIARKILPQRYPDPTNRQGTPKNWLLFIQYLAANQRKTLWRQEYLWAHQDHAETFIEKNWPVQQSSPANLAQYLDIKTYLPFDILTKVDVASMMHGLEVRTPFVDIKVLELAARIPANYNLARDHSGQWQGKLLLKKVMQRYYPENFLQRPKMGFAIPLSKWFAPDGVLHQAMQDRLLAPNTTLREYFEPAAIQNLISQNNSSHLWLLLVLEEWLGQNARILPGN